MKLNSPIVYPTPSPQLSLESPREGLAVLRLNRPEVKNALSMELRGALVRAFDALDQHRVPVVILTGAGDAFCAGLDLKELKVDVSALTSGEEANPIAAVRRFSGVVIGAVNGAAITGGFELALACDILIASDRARFVDTHLRVGVMPGWELSQRLSRTIGLYRAKHLALTGEYLDAGTAAAWGLVSEVTPAGRLLERAYAISDTLLAVPSIALRQYKSLIDEGYAGTLAEGLTIETERAAAHNGRLRAEEMADRGKMAPQAIDTAGTMKPA